MKNDIPVEEVIELKDELEMKDIMMLQDGITKEDVEAIIEEDMSVEEVIEMKEEMRDVVKLGGEPAESDKFPNFAKEAPEVINIDNSEGGVSFSEVLPNEDLVKTEEEDVSREILESVRNTRPNEVSSLVKYFIDKLALSVSYLSKLFHKLRMSSHGGSA